MTQELGAARRDAWVHVQTRHLAALAAIHEEGTFSEAAATLGYVQSAVSGQISALERIVGARLIERSSRPGRQPLTPAGHLLLLHAREILFELHAVGLDLDDTPPQQRADDLRVAVATGYADRDLNSLVTSVCSEGFSLAELSTRNTDQIVPELRAGALDVAFVTLPLSEPDIATATTGQHPPALVVSAHSPLARAPAAPTLLELSRLPLIAWREGEHPSRIEAELAAHGLQPRVVARTDSSDTAAVLAGMGVGAALLPATAVPDRDDLAVLELDTHLPERCYGVAWLRARCHDPRVRRLVELAVGQRPAD